MKNHPICSFMNGKFSQRETICSRFKHSDFCYKVGHPDFGSTHVISLTGLNLFVNGPFFKPWDCLCGHRRVIFFKIRNKYFEEGWVGRRKKMDWTHECIKLWFDLETEYIIHTHLQTDKQNTKHYERVKVSSSLQSKRTRRATHLLPSIINCLPH